MLDPSIPSLIDQLDHPDAQMQRVAIDALLAQGKDHADQLIANLKVTPPSKLSGLIQVLGELGLRQAMLPLMRLIVDAQDEVTMQDARGMAMKVLGELAGGEDEARVSAFLLEVYEDEEPFVRGWAMRAFASIGHRRAQPLLEAACKDPHPFVRARAQEALELLEAQAPPPQQDHIAPKHLVQGILASQGPRRTYWLAQLKAHPQALEVCDALIKAEGKGTLIGLGVLLERTDPEAPAIAARHLRIALSDAERAICLRLLAISLQAPMPPAHQKLVADHLGQGDAFVRQAALFAAARSGDPALATAALNTLDPRQDHHSLELASALDHAASYAQDALAPLTPSALEKLGKIRSARLSRKTDQTLAHTEAHLLSLLGKLYPHVSVGRRELQLAALQSLEGAEDQRPVLVSALRLLRDAKRLEQDSPLPPQARWPATSALLLAPLLHHQDPKVQTRALDLLLHGAPQGLSPLAKDLKPLLFAQREDTLTHLIPLLERAQGALALELLRELATSPSEVAIKDAANASLRRLDSDAKVREATFIRPPE